MFIVAAIVFPQSFILIILRASRQMPFRITTKNVLQFTTKQLLRYLSPTVDAGGKGAS